MSKRAIFILFILSIVTLTTSVEAQWQPVGFFGTVNGLVGTGGVLYASTNNGIYRSNDNGRYWVRVPTWNYGMPLGFTCIATIGTTVFAGSDGSSLVAPTDCVFRSSDQGSSWSGASSGLSQNSVTALASSGTVIYCGLRDSGVYRSTDLGAHWTAVNTGIAYRGVVSLAADGDRVFAFAYAGLNGGIYRSLDRGAHWTFIRPTGYFVNAINIAGDTIIVGRGDGVMRSVDGGTTWSDSTIWNLSVIGLARAGNVVVAATRDSGLYRSTDGGLSWESANTGVPDTVITAITARSGLLFAATISGGTIIASSDFGAHWNTVHYGVSLFGTGPITSLGSTLLMPGYGGMVRSVDEGQNWIYSSPDTSGLLSPYNLFATRSGTVYTSNNTNIFRSDDSGATWKRRDNGIPHTQTLFIGEAGKSLFAGLFDSSMYRSTDGGNTWVDVSSTMPKKTLICFASDDTAIFVGTNSGVFVSTDNGASWTPSGSGTVGEHIASLVATREAVYVSSQYNGVFRTTDRGANWSHIATPLGDSNYIVLFSPDRTTLFLGGWYTGWFSTDQGQAWVQITLGTYSNLAIGGMALTGDKLYLSSNNYGLWTRSFFQLDVPRTMISQSSPLLSVSPNPADLRTTIHIGQQDNGTGTTISLVDAVGRAVYMRDVIGAAGDQNCTLDLSGLASGMYRCVVNAGGSISQTPLVVRR